MSGQYSTNSIIGKQILSLIRNSDYAHPGEEEAIEIAFSEILPDPNRVILDVGCGLGGTANYVEKRGWGSVTGADIDREAIQYASEKYGSDKFIVSSVEDLSGRIFSKFDLIYLFTAFHTFSDQMKALREMHAVSKNGATLMIFDYAVRSGKAGAEEYAQKPRGSIWNPLVIDSAGHQLGAAGWKVTSQCDMSLRFIDWYEDLLNRLLDKESAIIELSNRDWFNYFKTKYKELLIAIKAGHINGILLFAERQNKGV